jgi:threonine aldolase
MDRRHFLAATGLAAASPALGQSVIADAPVDPRLFQGVNFYSDGLDYTPAEVAARLQQAVTREGFTADNYSLGGSVQALERKFAALMGKQAAMFVPTGTLANLLAVRKLAGTDRRVLVQAESHLYNDSGDGAQLLAGLNLVPLGAGSADITLDDVTSWVERSAGGRVTTPVGVISIESPVRRRDHAMADFDEVQRVCAYARERGIRLHLDGSRLFNLPLHSGRSLKDICALFDTVYVSTWKHFNSSAGAMLAGDADFIEGLYHQRRLFGGALPQAWPLLAVADAHVDTYEAEYAQAWRSVEAMMAQLEATGRFRFTRVDKGTCRFFMKVADTDARRLPEAARRHQVYLANPHPDTGVFTMQVNTSVLRSTPEALARALLVAAAG